MKNELFSRKVRRTILFAQQPKSDQGVSNGRSRNSNGSLEYQFGSLCTTP